MRTLLYLVVVAILFASCEKNDTNPIIEPVNKANYLPLEIGNYWVYGHYDIDTLGNETNVNRTDSMIINRDTIINEYQYFILEGTDYPYTRESWGIVDILRDSSGYIVNNKGQIKFSGNNFTDTLDSKIEVRDEDTLYVLTYQMVGMTDQIIVPAGEFEVLNFKGTVITSNPVRGVKNPRYLNNYFSDRVGKILETYCFLTRPIISEKRLLRYKIKEE